MSQGRLHVTLGAEGVSDEVVAAAEVIRGGAADSWTMPMRGGEQQQVEVPEGVYLVRAMLPTGEMLTRTTEVKPGEDAWVTLRATPTPWTAPGDEIEDDAAPDGDTTRGRTLFARLWSGSLTSSWQPDEEQIDDTGKRYVARLSTGIGMYAVQLGGPDTAWRVVCLPPAYVSTVTAAVDRSASDVDDGVTVTVRGLSALSDALAEYVTTGQLGEARIVAPQLVDQALHMFESKLASPEGAAVAGYFMLRVGRQEELGSWPRNFAEWFSWLPDARVIYAWQLLRRPGVPERDLAREQLLAAAAAGVPRYTEGVRLLHDGLQMFAGSNPHDAPVSEMLAAIRRYAAACDWTATPTTYWARRPDDPTLSRLTGFPADPAGWKLVELQA